MKFAVLVKNAFRGMSDVRLEIIDVPNSREDFGPVEAAMVIRQNLLGNFEVIAVTDRISERTLAEIEKDLR